MNILVIDPSWSGPTGYVQAVDDKVWSYGTLKASQVRDWKVRFDLFCFEKNAKQADCLIIEDTFFSKNVKSYGLLCRAKQLWISDATDHFCIKTETILEVSPQTWQRGLQRNWKFGAGSKKNMPEIEEYIRHRWFNGKAVKLTGHEISAFGLLTYFVDNNKRDK
jgi:hypothetical protein